MSTENLPIMTKEEICQMFGCSMEQLNDQYAANAKTLKGMRDKAVKSGKTVNNYTAAQLTEHANRYKAFSR